MVHQARLLPRLLMVGFFLLVSFAITGAIFWSSFLGTDTDGVDLGSRGGASPSGGAGVASDAVSLPSAWPEALAPPEGSTITSAVTTSGGTPEEQLILVVEVGAEGPAVAEALRAQLAAAGLTISSDSVTPDGFGSISATGAGWDASVAVLPDPAQPGTTTVSWVLRRGPR